MVFAAAGYCQNAPAQKGAAQKAPTAPKTVSGRLEISGSKIYYEECGSGSAAVGTMPGRSVTGVHAASAGRISEAI